MANPDRMFSDEKISNVAGFVGIFLVFILPLLVIIYFWLFKPEISSTNDQPSCYYSGDEYICDK